ncbi:hypothetical protein ATANTOWER_020474 [Ataeniobius toweri]|uniref:Uncharacterized protein n=1 Tax=Ataeniobius toweri TaxID=208326 RepID=A0ABU7AQ81_9TELE|nr:hypothetical protein [Ataeniobius toweri]
MQLRKSFDQANNDRIITSLKRRNKILTAKGEVKSQPVCNAETLTQQKLALFKPAPPATRKPQIPSRRIFCLTETDNPVAKKQLGRKNTTGQPTPAL